MALNIKNLSTVEKIKTTAAVLGVNYTTAIDIACESLLNHRHAPIREPALDRVLKIAETYRENLPAELDIIESDLYDDAGLYR